jgi:hypothetical protein
MLRDIMHPVNTKHRYPRTMAEQTIDPREIASLKDEIEMLMQDRQRLLTVLGAATVLVSEFDENFADILSDYQTMAAALLADTIGTLPEETVREALQLVQAQLADETDGEQEGRSH